jgi:hypothetical protein
MDAGIAAQITQLRALSRPPSLVNTTCRPERSTRLSPSRSSIRRSRYVTAGVVTFKARAAAARDLEAPSVTKNRRSSVEIIKPRLILYT